MIGIKWLGVILVAFFSVCVGWHYGVHSQDQDNSRDELSADINGFDALKIKVLEAEVKNLKKELGELAQYQTTLITAPGTSQIQPSVAPNFTKQLADEMNAKTYKMVANQKAKVARLNENYKNIKDYDLNRAITDTYEKETYNEEWAVKRESAIQEMFSKNEALKNSSIKSISCRSKHCRVQLFFQEENDISRLSEQLIRSIAIGKNDLFLGFMDSSYSEKDKVASLYLTDDPDAALY